MTAKKSFLMIAKKSASQVATGAIYGLVYLNAKRFYLSFRGKDWPYQFKLVLPT